MHTIIKYLLSVDSSKWVHFFFYSYCVFIDVTLTCLFSVVVFCGPSAHRQRFMPNIFICYSIKQTCFDYFVDDLFFMSFAFSESFFSICFKKHFFCTETRVVCEILSFHCGYLAFEVFLPCLVYDKICIHTFYITSIEQKINMKLNVRCQQKPNFW